MKGSKGCHFVSGSHHIIRQEAVVGLLKAQKSNRIDGPTTDIVIKCTAEVQNGNIVMFLYYFCIHLYIKSRHTLKLMDMFRISLTLTNVSLCQLNVLNWHVLENFVIALNKLVRSFGDLSKFHFIGLNNFLCKLNREWCFLLYINFYTRPRKWASFERIHLQRVCH